MWVIKIARMVNQNLDDSTPGMIELLIVVIFLLMMWGFPKCEILTHPIAILLLVLHFLILFWNNEFS